MKLATMLTVVSLSAVLLISGCSDIKSGGGSSPAPVQTGSTETPPVGTVPQRIASTEVMTYRVATTPDQVKLADANDLVAVPLTLPQGTKDPATYAISSLTTGEGAPLPPGTKLNSIKIDSASKVATLDFSGEFKSHFQGGDTKEAQAINSVLATMGQFPSVAQVQFLVQGKKIDSLGGTQELGSPLPIPQGTKLASGAGG